MIISNKFKKVIKKVFYDKEITRYTVIDTIDDEGWARKSGSTVTNGSFFANAHFNNFDKIQALHGITEQIDLVLTTDSEEANDQVIGYLGLQYYIFRVIPNDSHYLLVARKWSSKSSTLLSV